MKVFAISDLHLPGASVTKEMNVFGTKWDRHWDKIRTDWSERVCPEDVVLIAGDVSWAQTLDQAREDLRQIAAMPGKKVILKGNHDFWWSSISRLREVLQPDMFALQNDALRIGKAVFFGSRGWCKTIKNKAEDADNEKIYARELLRLKMSVDAAKKFGEAKRYGLAHFPPFLDTDTPDEVTEVFAASGAEKVIYGHVHGAEKESMDGVRFGNTEFILSACDYLDFRLKLIDEI